METDRHYFVEGLFIIGISLAAALFAVWLAGKGRSDDVLYRIHFSDSVSGLSVGDPVKYRGVEVGTVEVIVIDPADPRRVQVDVKLGKDTPVKTDTTATLNWKGITGVVFIDLNGGSPEARSLLAATPADKVPEIPADKNVLQSTLDKLPTLVEKFSALEDQMKKVLTDVSALTSKLKENPSLLLSAPKEQPTPAAAKAQPSPGTITSSPNR